MKQYIAKTFFGDYSVEIRKHRYANNKNLAIDLIEPDMMPFARLTVNLGKKLPEGHAYLDVNNCPWAENFVMENGLGEPTDRIGMSGFCFYPEYKFDMAKLAE